MRILILTSFLLLAVLPLHAYDYGMGQLGQPTYQEPEESYYERHMREMREQTQAYSNMIQSTDADNTRRQHSNYCREIQNNYRAQQSCFDGVP